MAVTMTERAAQHVAGFLQKRGKGVGLRLGSAHDRVFRHGLQARIRRRGAARRPVVRVSRREDPGRSEESRVHRRHRARFRPRGTERRVPLQQSRTRRTAAAAASPSTSSRADRARGAPGQPRTPMSHPDHFALFALPARFALDESALERAHKDVQSKVHPDRFAAGSAAERRVAMQWAARANEAYRTLEVTARAGGLPVRTGRGADRGRVQHRDAGGRSSCSNWSGASRSTMRGGTMMQRDSPSSTAAVDGGT